MTRDYKKEYAKYHGKPEQIKRRSSRNKARRKLKVEGKGGANIHHKDGNPLNNSRSNLAKRTPKNQRIEGGRKSKR